MTQKKHRKFTAEQKAEAVRIVGQSGRPIHQVALELGLTPSALSRWVEQAEIDQNPLASGKLTSPERQELTKLRQELKRVEMERDFLKKVATFFAKDNTGLMS